MQHNDVITAATLRFQDKFQDDTAKQSGEARYVGLENEYLLVSSSGNIMPLEELQYLWNELAYQGWELTRDSTTGKITSARKARSDFHALRTHNYDVITTDYGYSTLEINLAPVKCLQDAHRPLYELIELVTSILSKRAIYLLGYGVQPVTPPGRQYIGPKSRYELIFDVRDQEDALNPRAQTVDLHCMNASCQTQVDVSTSEAIPILNALNATAGLRIALFANSPVWQNKISGYKAIRELFWDWCWPNRKQQVGIPPRFSTIEQYVDYLLDFRSIAVNRHQTFYRLSGNTTFRHFLTNKHGEEGISFDGHKMLIIGEADDIRTQYAFAWIDTRLQPLYGTVEDRVSCQQPPHAHFCSQAVTLGLVENYSKLAEMANEISLDQWRDIRLLACTHGMDFSYPGVDVRALIKQLLHTAYAGLKKRGFGEEVYLEPLYERVETGQCPADHVRDVFLKGGVEAIVRGNDMRRFLNS